jgi:hypothetical protein
VRTRHPKAGAKRCFFARFLFALDLSQQRYFRVFRAVDFACLAPAGLMTATIRSFVGGVQNGNVG